MHRITLIALCLTLATGGCGAGAFSPIETSNPPVARSIASPAADYASFSAWRDDFRRRAIAGGIRAEVFDAAFVGVSVNPEVLRLDGHQAEFTRPLWEYIDGAASADRIATGRSQRASRATTLAAIESRFGVDRDVVLAIWGMESNFGSFKGSMSVIRSLATLAYQGRRREWAEEQLVAALMILQAGDTGPGNLIGSWAGAMGHTQFMPTSFLTYAVDFTGDGRRDIWGSDPTDALASAANYLARNGWQRGAPWGLEVRLPAGFNYASADQSNRRPVAEWRSRGVTRLDGSPLPDHGPAAVMTPAGATGPAFIVYENFFVIKRYNNATSYAMGVGHLADRIGGGGPFVQSWPRGERELSRSEKIELQERLIARGFDPGSTDGIIGPDTQGAIRAFQASQGITPDGFANSALLARLR